MYKIGVIGCGNMGEAIIAGLLAKNVVQADQIIGSNKHEVHGREIAERYDIEVCQNNCKVAHTEVVILAVKPQIIDLVVTEIAEALPKTSLVISIAAGVPLKRLCGGLKHEAVVRAMPNTPASIGAGMTVWMATDAVSEEMCKRVENIFRALGTEMRVGCEEDITRATAISGSGPALVFYLMEAFIDAAVRNGVARSIAELWVKQTFYGAAIYARERPLHLAYLRNQVTSPGGTTAESLYEMDKGGVSTTIQDAIRAAYQRARELGSK